MIAESLGARRSSALAKLATLYGDADTKLKVEAQALRNLRTRTGKIAGNEAADKLTRDEIARVQLRIDSLSVLHQELVERIQSARNLVDIADSIREMEDAISNT